MPDEIRTLEELQTLFADNETGEISPQDLRDFLITAGLKNTAQTWTADQAIQNNLNIGIQSSQNGGIAINSAASPTSTITLVGNTGTITCAVIEAGNLATVATTGSWNNLSDVPPDPNPNVPDAPSSTTGNHGLYWNGSTWEWINIGAFDGSYGTLTGTPTDPNPNVPDRPESDGNFVLNVATGTDTWATADYAPTSHTHVVADITDFPSLATVATTGSYNDLSDTPSLATVATTGSYNDLSDTPSLATVATTGAYSDLTGVPSEFPPSAHTHVVSDITDFPTLATVATSGSYTDLINTPGVPNVPGSPATDYILHWNGSSWEWLSYAGSYVPSAPGAPNTNDRYKLQWNGSAWEWFLDNGSDANPGVPDVPGSPATANYFLNYNGSTWQWANSGLPAYAEGTPGRYLLQEDGSGNETWTFAREVPAVGTSNENLGQFLMADGVGGYAWTNDYNPQIPNVPGGDGRFVLNGSAGWSWDAVREVPAVGGSGENDGQVLTADGSAGYAWASFSGVPAVGGSGENDGQYLKANGSGGFAWATDYNPSIPDAPGSPTDEYNYVLHWDQDTTSWSWLYYAIPNTPGGVTGAESFILHYDGSGNWSWLSAAGGGAANVPDAPTTDSRYVLQTSASGTAWGWEGVREVPTVGTSNENLGQFLMADGVGGYAWTNDYNPQIPNVPGGDGRFVLNGSAGWSWDAVREVPAVGGSGENNGQVLTADGSAGYAWASFSGVPAPVNPDDDDKLLKANGGGYSWQPDPNPNIPNTPESDGRYVLNGSAGWSWDNAREIPVPVNPDDDGKTLIASGGSYGWNAINQVPTVGGSGENDGQYLKANGSGGYAWAADFNPNIPDAPGSASNSYALRWNGSTFEWTNNPTFDNEISTVAGVSAAAGQFTVGSADGTMSIGSGGIHDLGGDGTFSLGGVTPKMEYNGTSLTIDGVNLIFTNLPTVDPDVAGQLWNNSGVLSISDGP